MRGQSIARLRPRSRFASLALAAGLCGPPLVSAAAQAPSPTPSPDPSDEAERKQAARAQVQAGSAAFKLGDYQLAIDHYEAAIALLPAPKLHYNLGVCHQRLSLDAANPEQRTRERDLAIESYNAYLEQNPRAEDRLEVAATIRELGGTPITMPTLKPLFESDTSTQDPDPSLEPDPLPQPSEPLDPALQPPSEPAGAPTPVAPNHGRFGVALAGGYSPTLHAAAAIDAKGMLAFDIHGGGFVGPRRRLLIAAHTSFYSGVASKPGVTSKPDGLLLTGYSFGLLTEQTWVLGREAAMLGLGGVVALTGQGLSARAGMSAPACRVSDTAQVAGHSGALLAARFELGVLLGAHRRSSIGMLLQPSVAIVGDGRSGSGCEAGETPWTDLGVRRRWQFQLWAGAGYSFRF